MNRKIIKTIIISSLVLTSGALIAFAASNPTGINSEGVEKMMNVANAIKEYNATNKEQRNEILGTMDGEPIYSDEFTLIYKKAVASGSTNPYEDAINSLKEMKADLQYAETQGISVTEEEVLDYVKYQQTLYEEETDEAVKSVISSYIKALGLTEDEYWNDYEIKESEKYLLHEKVLKSQRENSIDRAEFLKNKSLEITNKNFLEQSIDSTIDSMDEVTNMDAPEPKEEE